MTINKNTIPVTNLTVEDLKSLRYFKSLNTMQILKCVYDIELVINLNVLDTDMAKKSITTVQVLKDILVQRSALLQ